MKECFHLCDFKPRGTWFETFGFHTKYIKIKHWFVYAFLVSIPVSKLKCHSVAFWYQSVWYLFAPMIFNLEQCELRSRTIVWNPISKPMLAAEFGWLPSIQSTAFTSIWFKYNIHGNLIQLQLELKAIFNFNWIQLNSNITFNHQH